MGSEPRAGTFADRRPTPSLVVVTSLVYIGLVAWLDHVTGVSVSLGVLYVAPIALTTWYVGPRPGLFLCVVAVGLGYVADARLGVPGVSRLIPIWNTTFRLLMFLFVVFLLARVRASVEELRRAGAAQQDAAERLRAADEVKNTFLHAVSHELRTPLTSVLGFARTLQEHPQDLAPEVREELLDRLVSNARRLDALLGDLLDLDRLTRGVLTLRRTQVDLGALAALVLEPMDVGDRPVTLETTPVVISVDTAKVERIVENLVANAARHTPAGTPIHVRVEAVADGALLSVDDEGPGVPPELASTLFEPFQRGPDATAPGTGIGLSLVARFAELHGGRVWVEESPGGGAGFRVLLPSDRTDADPGSDTAPPAPEDLGEPFSSRVA